MVLDAETGFYYYGARYYEPKSSLWLSVDPLAEKMPDWSPYNYALNNPINFVDPTGMAPDGWGKGEDGKWHYDKNVTAENYKEKYTDYRPDGSILENATINNGKIGSVYLGGSADNVYYVDNNPFTPSLLTGEQATYLGDAFSIGKFYQYNSDFWLDKNLKFRSSSFNGNGFTGGKNKFAKTLSKDLGRVGTVLGIYSMYYTNNDFNEGKISQNRMVKDQTVNVIGFLGPYGASFNLGWNLGYLIEDISGTNIQINWDNIRKGYDTDRWFEDPEYEHGVLSDKFLAPRKK